MALPPGPDQARASRLAAFYTAVVKGKRSITTDRDSVLFLEAICNDPDSTSCVERLIASNTATDALRTSLRFNISTTFLNGHLECFLRYLRDPTLKHLCNGEFLRRLLVLVVDPPSLWYSIVEAHSQKQLSLESQHSFAWLLLELLSWNDNAPSNLQAVVQDIVDRGTFIDSEDHDVRALGHHIKHVLHAKSGSLPVSVSGPGGRHDNDFADFRQIAIYPTEDEIMSKDTAFYRHADAVANASADQRLAVHLDNQFRLLREDMLAELRDDLKLSQTNKKRRSNTRLHGLALAGFYCGFRKNRTAFSITVTCKSGLERLSNRTTAERQALLKDDRKFLKHQSVGCLMDSGRVIAFATLDRNEKLLAAEPPVVTLRIPEIRALGRVLRTLKLSKNVEFLVVDTAMFAYQPILDCLQQKLELPLADELLFLKEKEPNQRVEPSSICPDDIVQAVEDGAGQHLDGALDLPHLVDLDPSQAESLLAGLKQTVSLIQGPPGTGKSFVGALIAKAFHDHTSQKIMVICHTNHALDQFLEDLLDIGIPDRSMIRLGAKSSSRTEHLSISNQKTGHQRNQATWAVIDKLEMELQSYESSLQRLLGTYMQFSVRASEIFEYLEFSEDDSSFFDAFLLPTQNDGFEYIGEDGHPVKDYYLYDRWCKGEDAGIFRNMISPTGLHVWSLDSNQRREKINQWTQILLEEKISGITNLVKRFDESQRQLHHTLNEQNAELLRQKRIIACTTTAAAKYFQQLQSASPDIILVEEAGEILESHVITAMTPHTKQLVLIGDHQQLRPKVNNYALTVEQGDGYDLNRSLFERLILAGFPHTTLMQQHRMCPEISTLVRNLTYPDLLDAPSTQNRPALRGLQNRVIFFDHQELEVSELSIADRRDQGSGVSKMNEFEADIVLRIVRYLAQQGYGTSDQVVLTPYLGQLSLLRKRLSKENDPVLNELDSFDLIKAGLLAPTGAGHKGRTIRLSTIDNYQGEEKDIVIASLTRANKSGDIGFMSSPERLNVLLSRARNGLILIGNSNTFLSSRKGKKTWGPFFDLLSKNGHMYDGLPVRCEQHPSKKMVLKQRGDFEELCPDGGCSDPCGTKLSCGIHDCPSRCHQLADHSKMECQQILTDACPRKHKLTWRCFAGRPSVCAICDSEAREKAEKLQRDAELEEVRQKKQRAYARELAELQDEIAHERRLRRENAEQEERDRVIRQHQKDLQNLQSGLAGLGLGGQNPPVSQSVKAPDTPSPSPPGPPSPTAANAGSIPAAQQANKYSHDGKGKGPWKQPDSPAKDEWEYQKKFEGASSDTLDDLMSMIGLENVKEEFLAIKDKIEVAIRQGIDMKDERFGAALLGNPGTGKTTVARLYAKFLSSFGALPGHHFVETSGSRLANDGVSGSKQHIDDILNAGGGALFIDEAYQLASGNSPTGKQVLDFLLAEVENLTGKVVFILAGYNKQMESFFAHNPGIPSRFPREIQFRDYKDEELLEILNYNLDKRYQGKMRVELGCRGLYARIVARRIGRGRGHEGFGNARAVENNIARIVQRQAKRLRKERKAGALPDDFLLTQADLLGPEPQDVLKDNASWDKLQQMIGLGSVKSAIQALFDVMQYNYTRELDEEPLIDFSLNKVFLGNPGTGKTTVAKLYGQILADMGFLSTGEMVVKSPADFIGQYIGQSEAKTKGILAATLGKVLVIDEAYSLYDHSAKGGNTNSFKNSVIDTIVAEVQSVPGDNRCVLLLGYKERMEEMFQEVNPGLTRRFPLDSAFNFEDFSKAELEAIFDLKLKQLGFKATKEAKAVALDMLCRSRNRLHFGNAGEIDILFNKAKLSHQQRLGRGGKRKIAAIFEAPDFDPDFDRGARAETNVDVLFEGVIGCDEIVAQLKGYQRVYANMKALGLDPSEQLPFAFLFRGPPGTGKTSTAKRMGKVYYDMGFLASAEVVECSATDLVGEYVGHTGPKTQRLFEKALGKVLFIDEAYRLGSADRSFAKEAVDEMVDCLTKEKFARKLVVVLAGYDADVNRLMLANPGLTSRFPETVNFRPLSPAECLDLLAALLLGKGKKKGDVLDAKVFDPPLAQGFRDRVVAAFAALAALPNWANARDVRTVANAVFARVMRGSGTTTTAAGTKAPGVVVSEACVLAELDRMLEERTYRALHVGNGGGGGGGRGGASRLPTAAAAHPPPPPPPPEATDDDDDAPNAPPPPTASASGGGGAGAAAASGAGDGGGGSGASEAPPHPPPTLETDDDDDDDSSEPGPETPSQESDDGDGHHPRDAGVGAEVWEQLLRDERAARAEERAYRSVVDEERRLRREVEVEASELDAAAAARTDGLDGGDGDDGRVSTVVGDRTEGERRDDAAADDAKKLERERMRLQRIEGQRRRDEEEERRREEVERKRRELAEIERRRVRMEEDRRREVKKKDSLRRMGVCCMGYQWIKQKGGYRYRIMALSIE
ncbi:hypothetical protein SLS58_002204 [Diplodia intermedia]|uniref:AAA+ ATPase domain-containing protein n=1 Tax=Diplodia intermedia TaxID=856260 RepID=A0ABR3U025_9PEZI